MKIRKATINDLPIVQKMLGELLQYEKTFDSTLKSAWAYSEDSKKKLSGLIEKNIVLIAEEANYPIGYLIGKIDDSIDPARDTKHAHISNLYVTDSMRQGGVGAALVNEFKGICKGADVKSLTVSVLCKNEIAILFYQKMGLLPRTLFLEEKI